ncbi:MAG: radical SAM protein [Chamaesiphon sp.]|nr:radical SAM protein [Chamaesiphon sp.]
MKPETIDGIKSLIEKRSSKLRYLHISWFGGEPLLAKDIVMDISAYAQSLASQYFDLTYSGGMTINGYLLDVNTLHALVDVGVTQYQISLDGPKEIHDRTRIRADGKSTFQRIWSNLMAIRDSSLPVSILLRLHLTADTFQLIDPLLEDIKRELLPDPRFSAFFKPIEHLGGPNDPNINTVSEHDKKIIISSLEYKLFGDGSNSIEYQKNAAPSDDYVCYASRPNSLIIRADGSIGKCTVALTDKRNHVGTLTSDGKLELNPDRLRPWMRGIETLDPETLGCPLVSLPLE